MKHRMHVQTGFTKFLTIVMMSLLLLLTMVTASIAEDIHHPRVGPPNIIFILADDMGWNDVSYHGSPQIPTPNIDAMAASGIAFHKYYTAPQCTPSRASLMTGKYAIRLGLQHFVINAGAPNGLPPEVRIMPQYLNDLGYSTHAVGKWHLGFHRKEYLPTNRGFDSFFGYWNGLIDYYDYTNYETVQDVQDMKEIWGIDLHNGTDAVTNVRGRYATDLFTDKAQEIIEKHNDTKPLFLYVSHLACHTGNDYMRMQAPPDAVSNFSYIRDVVGRRTYAGVVKKLDESVGRIFSSLEKRGLLSNSIVVFSSDNGGEAEGIRGGHASNWPLRSMKFHLWEGGVRVPAIVWSPLFELKAPKVVSQLMHITDWLPTLYRAAGGVASDLDGHIDGMDMWSYLLTDEPLPRRELLLNIDPMDQTAAIIKDDFKLITGVFPDGNDHWYGPSGKEEINPSSMDDWVWMGKSEVKDILARNGMWLISEPDTWRSKLAVDCGKCHDYAKICRPNVEPCLFNLNNDPCELENIAQDNSLMVKTLMNRLKKYERVSVNPQFAPVDPKSDPRCHGFNYVPWMDEERVSNCS